MSKHEPRKVPDSLLNCQQGDVVCLWEIGKVQVTGPNMGITKAHRLVRLIDDNGKIGRAMPLVTTSRVTRIVELYYSKTDGEMR